MLSPRLLTWVAALALLSVACVRSTFHPCSKDDDCKGSDGEMPRCEATRACSVLDPSCGVDGRRYIEQADPAYAGVCVDGELDAGPDAPPDALDGAIAVDPAVCMKGLKRTAAVGTCEQKVCDVEASCCLSAWTEACIHRAERLCETPCARALFVGGATEAGIFALDGVGVEPTPVWRAPSDTETYGADWADYDGDGIVDLATASTGSQRIYKGSMTEAGFTLTLIADLGASGFGGHAADWADVDNDQDLDVAFGGAGGVFIARQNATHHFVADPALVTGIGQVDALGFGDINLDGFPELVTGTGTGALFFRNNHGALAQEAVDFGFPAAFEGLEGVEYCNLDDDPAPELLLTGLSFVHIHDTAGNVIGPTHPPIWEDGDAFPILEVGCGDLTGDGRNDFVAGGWNNRPRIYQNTDGTLDGFRETILDPVFADAGLDIGDFDGDHDLDVVIGDFGSAKLTVYMFENDGVTLKEPDSKIELGIETPARMLDLGPTVPITSP